MQTLNATKTQNKIIYIFMVLMGHTTLWKYTANIALSQLCLMCINNNNTNDYMYNHKHINLAL